MKISGSAVLSEGKINEDIVSSGSTILNGNIECEGFKSTGSLKGKGNLSILRDFRCSGTFNLVGDLTVDGDAKSSGTTTVDGEMLILGEYTKSGSLRAGNQVKAHGNVKISGLTKIHGNLLSEKDVDLRGNSTITGNIKAENIFIGMPIDDFRPFKHPYKVHGNLVADNEVNIKKTFVGGDIEGRDVIIGLGTEVIGTVYYIDSIEVSSRATLANKPVQIKDK